VEIALREGNLNPSLAEHFVNLAMNLVGHLWPKIAVCDKYAELEVKGALSERPEDSRGFGDIEHIRILRGGLQEKLPRFFGVGAVRNPDGNNDPVNWVA
jgi:hypothetical protein